MTAATKEEVEVEVEEEDSEVVEVVIVEVGVVIEEVEDFPAEEWTGADLAAAL